MYDTIILNATIFSGKKDAPQQTHLAIQNDRIAAIGDELAEAEAKETVDATGLYLTPGFIDTHASTGFGYFFPKAADHKLYQGITTEIFGNCGTSPGPIGAGLVETMEGLSRDIGFPFSWRSLGEYFDAISDKLQFNIASLVGHSTLRGGYVTDVNHPTAAEQQAMQDALAQAMDEGAIGFSTGLIYAPGCFAEMQELVDLAKVTQEKGGLYASHIRNERDKIEEAVEEALAIGDQAGIKVLVSHLKAAEKPNWGKIDRVLEMIGQYNETHDIKAKVDVYPYTAVSTKMRAFIPKYLLDQGMQALPARLQKNSARDDIDSWVKQKDYDLDKMLIISNDIPAYHGKTVHEVSREMKQTYGRTMGQVIAENTETWIVYHCINEEDMDKAILWDEAMVCTDSWSYPINAPKTIGEPHPRSYGAFTAYLERYVLQQQSLDWPEAIYKVTKLPADFFGLKDRGVIEPGYFADLVLFDPNNIRNNATYLKPRSLSDGVEYLWINGRKTISQKEVIQDALAGRVLS